MIISAMKQAIDVLEILPEHGGNAFTRAADALRQVIAEAEKQEPVAWITEWNGKYSSGKVVDWVAHARGESGKHTPLYTAPPKREWVGLTDEDVKEVFNTAYDGENFELIGDFLWFAELIEAKLKEKNSV